MGSISVNTGNNTGKDYYDYLKLDVIDYGQTKLEEKQDEIKNRESKKMTMPTKTSKTTYIMLAIGVVAILTLAILKKKGLL